MSIDWFTFAAQIVNFIVLAGLLNHFLYGPITRAMQQREQDIADRLTSAEEQQDAAEIEQQKYKQLANSLESEKKKVMDAAREEAARTRESLLIEARRDVQTRRDDWLKSLEREKESLVNSVRTRASQQVISATGQIVSQLADISVEELMFGRFLVRIKDLDEEQLRTLQNELNSGHRATIKTRIEMSNDWRDRFEAGLANLNIKHVEYETENDLICGVELHLGGQKLGWSAQEYLSTLSDEIGGLLSV